MAAAALVTVEEYLSTSYEPECEYVDGVVLDRHAGERDHSSLLGAVMCWLHTRRREFDGLVYPILRVRLGPTRIRVPDICVFRGEEPQEDIPSRPPFLCVEILSPDDRAAQILEKIHDYLEFGVPCVWVIDPAARRGWVYTTAGCQEVRDGVLRAGNPEIAVPLAEIFAEL